MKRIALLQRKHRRADRESGFTITELIAGLLIAALLLAGLIDMTRRFAQSTERVKAVSANLRSERLLDALLRKFERADPGTLRMTLSSLSATVGAENLVAIIQQDADGVTQIRWSSGSINRSFAIPWPSKFEALPSGLVALKAVNDGAVLAMIGPKRTIPFDCQFDTVIRECRD